MSIKKRTVNQTPISKTVITTSLDNYEEEAEYSCPNCERVESDTFEELVEQIKESEEIPLARDNSYLDSEDFDLHNTQEDLSGTGAFLKKCQRCDYEYQVDASFDCAGSAEWMFQDKEHHDDYLAGDA